MYTDTISNPVQIDHTVTERKSIPRIIGRLRNPDTSLTGLFRRSQFALVAQNRKTLFADAYQIVIRFDKALFNEQMNILAFKTLRHHINSIEHALEFVFALFVALERADTLNDQTLIASSCSYR